MATMRAHPMLALDRKERIQKGPSLGRSHPLANHKLLLLLFCLRGDQALHVHLHPWLVQSLPCQPTSGSF